MKCAIKWIAMIMVVALLFSISACTPKGTPQDNPAQSTEPSKQPSEPSAEPTQEAQEKEEIDLMKPFAPYPEPVVISVGRENNAGGQFAPGQSAKDNGYLDLLKEALNIEIVVDFDVAGGDYDETLMMRAASDSLPDSFGISSSARSMTLFKQLVEAGKLADLTEAYNKCIGGKTKEFMSEVNLEELLQFVTVDGKIYAVNGGAEGYNTALMWIRKDWLDKCGLEVPKTLEDLEKVALEFVKQKPGGQENTIGICFNPDPNGGIFGQWFGLLPVFNAVGSYPDIWIEDSNGKIVYGSIQPETKKALGILARWVELGIFSKDMLTMANGDETRDTYVSTNACGIIFNAWWDPWVQWSGYMDASVRNDQSKVWIPVMAPLNAEGKFSPKNETNNPGGQVILASHEHPEALIKAINLFDEVEKYKNPEFQALRDKYITPIMGATDSFRTNSPFRYATLLTSQNRLVNAEVINNYIKTGTLNLDPRVAGDVDWIQGAYNWAKNNTMNEWYAMSEEQRTDEKKAFFEQQYVGHWAFDVVGNLYLEGIKSGLYVEKNRAFVGVTESEQDYGQMLTDLRNTAFMQIISGEKPLDYFDEFVEQWKQLGGDIITKEVNEMAGRK